MTSVNEPTAVPKHLPPIIVKDDKIEGIVAAFFMGLSVLVMVITLLFVVLISVWKPIYAMEIEQNIRMQENRIEADMARVNADLMRDVLQDFQMCETNGFLYIGTGELPDGVCEGKTTININSVAYNYSNFKLFPENIYNVPLPSKKYTYYNATEVLT